MAILDWPSAERPREKLVNRGADALSDAEFLAKFLPTGTGGLSAAELTKPADAANYSRARLRVCIVGVTRA